MIPLLLQTTFQASILVGIVLLIQSLFGKRLQPRWRFALWWLVLIRLLLPATPESSLSLFNHLPQSLSQTHNPHPTTPISPPYAPPTAIPETSILPALSPHEPAPDEPIEIGPSLSLPPRTTPPKTVITTPTAEPQARQHPRDSILLIATFVWATGALFLFGVTLLHSIRVASRLCKWPHQALPQYEPLLNQCRSELGIKQNLTLGETALAPSPLIVGLFRPKLLLPAGLHTSFSPEELRHIFLHELAHIKRGDLFLNWLLTLLQAIHWFNPIVWLGFHRLRADRELVCDEIALIHSHDSSPIRYGQTLLKLLERLSEASPHPGTIGILQAKHQLKQRVNTIVQFEQPKRSTLYWAFPLIVSLGIVTLTDATQTPSVDRNQPKHNDASSRDVFHPSTPDLTPRTVTVLELETGTPIANAHLQVNYFSGKGRMESYDLATDTTGKARLPEPREGNGKSLNVWVTAEHRVPKVISWRDGNAPETYTLHMPPARTIQGIVVDPEGTPVSNVTLQIMHHHSSDFIGSRTEFHPRLTAVTTDDAGRWSIPYVPTDFKELRLKMTHDDFAVTQEVVPLSETLQSPIRMTLDRGWDLTGIVRDVKGRPILNATLREVHNYSGRERNLHPDPDGSFVFKGLADRDTQILIQAEGYVPLIKRIRPAVDPHHLDIVMRTGRPVTGTVVDESGNPIPEARVRLIWKSQFFEEELWSDTTDGLGKFHWDAAPKESVILWVAAQGFYRRRNVELPVDQSEHRIVLQKEEQRPDPKLTVQGRVQDASTGLPVPEFKVLLGEVREGDSFPDYSDVGTVGTKGSFKFSVPPPLLFENYTLQIQAPGYLPIASEPRTVKGDAHTLDFSLKRGTGPKGTVLLPNGVPASGAEVLMVGFKGSVYMNQPRQVRKEFSEPLYRIADAEGNFEFPAKLDIHSFVAVHPDGYASVSAQAFHHTPVISLREYSQVMGTLYVHGKPAAGETVSIRNMNYPYYTDGRSFGNLSLWLETKTDTDGQFTFESVPSGERLVAHKLGFRDGKLGPIPFTSSQYINLNPGETAHVQLGGTGRSIVGSVELPEGFQGTVDWQDGVQKLVNTESTDPPFLEQPARTDYLVAEDFHAALQDRSQRHRTFWSSEEGRSRQQKKTTYVPIFAPNGRFQVSDVPPGDYLLKLSVKASQGENSETSLRPYYNPPTAELSLPVRVPEMASAYNLTPLDLGTLHLESTQSTRN